MSNTFKKGDRVRVIRGVLSTLPENREFTVDFVAGDHIYVGTVSDGWYWDRFELVKPQLTEGPRGQEVDPTGRNANAPGAKLDAGKQRPALVLGEFARALEAVVEVGTVGATKYTPRGWLEVPNGQERYADAAFRHQLKVWKGERVDDGPGGTGKLHKAQVIWNLLAELELELRNADPA